MGKKIMNALTFLIVLGACIVMTVYIGKGSVSTMTYNFVFLGIMTVLYLAGLFMGMFRVDSIAQALKRGTEELAGIFQTPGKVKNDSLTHLQGIFDHKYLDDRMDSFINSMGNTQEGIGDVEEFINEDEIDLHVHKKLLEMVPDIFTSLGILGTFVGLVWGLKNFEPSSYETMTNSVASLVEGIKVAFLTSIYGIALAIVYTSGMKSIYAGMNEKLQEFLEKFHVYVLPTAENESRNLMVASQKLQTRAMKQMAEQLSTQMAESFEKAITPTFQKMNESLDVLTESVTKCQQDVMQEILRSFMREMNSSFKMQFKDFNEALAQLKKAQKDNTDYTTSLYRTMSEQLNESYLKQSETMKEIVNELGNVQGRYMSTATRIAEDNQEIQKMQQQDYQHVVDYLKDAEKSAAKFWVACNQAMQKYVETAAASIEKVGATGQASADLIRANQKMAEEFTAQMEDFAQYQRLSYKTMEQVRKLLSEVTAANTRDVSLIASGRNDSIDKLGNLIAQQNEGQQALLEEINKNMKELSKAAQKGKFGLFR